LITFHFISCGEGDLDILRQISIRTFVDTYAQMNKEENVQQHIHEAFNSFQLLSELRDPHQYFFFLYVDNDLAGYIKLNIRDAQTEAFADDVIELERIYLLKKYQGKGFGRLLINKALQVGKELNCSRMWLGVWKKNPGAVGFYERVGFKIFDEHTFTVGDEDQSDWMMDIYF